MMAFPMRVAVKKVVKGIRKWPQVIPARSKRGLGILAHSSTVKKAYFYKYLNINNLTVSTKDLLSLLF